VSEEVKSKRYDTIERTNRTKYEQEYDVASVSPASSTSWSEYFRRLTGIRLALIRKYGYCKTVLDVCCGTGDHILESRYLIETGVGVDFSRRMIRAAKSKKNSMKATNIEFAVCNARKIPFREKTFDLAYSFSSLYHIPCPEEVVFEVARVLKPNSIAVLEFGNLYSLNTIVCKAYPELAIPCHSRISEVTRVIKDAALEILECRRFQILPMWGSRPNWLKPLLHPVWKSILKKEIGQRMLDELLCSAPILKSCCFRQMFICKRA